MVSTRIGYADRADAHWLLDCDRMAGLGDPRPRSIRRVLNDSAAEARSPRLGRRASRFPDESFARDRLSPGILHQAGHVHWRGLVAHGRCAEFADPLRASALDATRLSQEAGMVNSGSNRLRRGLSLGRLLQTVTVRGDRDTLLGPTCCRAGKDCKRVQD